MRTFTHCLFFAALFLLPADAPGQPAPPAADGRPNFVWIVAEDLGPELGCYGDPQARTPNIDALAAQGARFTRAFTHAPVCAPSRSGLVTGMYPTTIGSHHMRSQLLKPAPLFTKRLRDAGYFVVWPGKTDFNFEVPPGSFDTTQNWLQNKRVLDGRRPFFAYVNLGESHESQIRADEKVLAERRKDFSPQEVHDPAKMEVPPYHPDTPEVRRDLANYYDLVTFVDRRVGRVLARLDEMGVADNTVVFFFGDHGRGLPRSKRWVYDSGIRVPLLVRWPGKIAPASVRDDLVSFIDMAPTVLTAAGVNVPPEMQGQYFLDAGGKPNPMPRQYVFAHRDRMDETDDRIRAVRDRRYKYVRNFRPELPYAQRVAYGELMPTLQAWRRLNAAGELTGPQKLFFAPTKPPEELYDVEADPHEVNNLAASKGPEHQKALKELRAALDRWVGETNDLGAVPERELIQRGLVKDVLQQYEQRKQP